MSKLLLRALVCGFAGSLLVMSFSGCEEGPDTTELETYFDENPYTFVARPELSLITLVVTPSSATLEYDGAKAKMKAHGGTPPYSWEVIDVALGSIIGSGENIVYQRDAVGDNVVKLRDSAGAVVYAIMKQPEEE